MQDSPLCGSQIKRIARRICEGVCRAKRTLGGAARHNSTVSNRLSEGKVSTETFRLTSLEGLV